MLLLKGLSNIFKVGNHQALTWEMLEEAPIGEWIDLSTGELFEESQLKEGVYYKKFPSKVPNQNIFIARLFSKSSVTYSTSDCKETFTVIKGSFCVNNKRPIKKHESKTFYKNVVRTIAYYSGDPYCEVFAEFNKH